MISYNQAHKHSTLQLAFQGVFERLFCGCRHSVGMGAVVVMDDRIMSARDCRKVYPRSGASTNISGTQHLILGLFCEDICCAGGFGVGDMGMLGALNSDGAAYFCENTANPPPQHGLGVDLWSIDLWDCP